MNFSAVDLKNGKGDIYQGEAKEKAGVTLTLDDDDMISLVGGQLNPQQVLNLFYSFILFIFIEKICHFIIFFFI